jgi:hypothetical protein
MNIITIFNFVINLIIIGFLIRKFNPFWISIDRTFWMKKLLSITLMYRYSKTEYNSGSKGLYTLTIRSRNKWADWDSNEYLKSKPKNYITNKNLL